MEAFRLRFGTVDTVRLIAAAASHDPRVRTFKDALYTAGDYECIGAYAKHHGFTASAADLKAWYRENGIAYFR
jgi:hypothetical protein